MKRTIKIVLLTLLIATSVSHARRAELLEIPEVSRDKVICFCLYTVQNNVLKMTAQLYPLQEGESRTVRLEVRQVRNWKQIAEAPVIEQGWTALLRVEDWDSTKDVEYRVAHGEKAYYEGTIKKDPVDKEEIVVAAFTGNSIYPGHGGDIPKTDIVANIKKIKPDLLFFSGDQVYDHFKHYAYWLKFGRDFGEIIRNIPTVTIPDDHDIGQGNLWGQGGRLSKTRAGHDGGYAAPVEYVKEVERAQTSHLPDPYDPTPVERGIGVYYTALTVGRVSFAILEDRKFKSGPEGLVPQRGPRPDHVNDPNYDPKSVDVPGAVLLGERQLKFLRDWGTDWHDCDIKCVLSQTVLCGGAHLHGSRNNRLVADLDSNGWPQSGRNRALREIRRAFAFMIAGDQHLATIIHHGIDDWNDSGYSLCVPSIANLYLRWWAPLKPGKNREPGAPEYLGEFLDGLGNKITMLAVANPTPEENRDKLTTRAAGFGVVRFNTKTRKITIECWPRNVDVASPGAEQYPGWPRTIDQIDNYGREALAYLPTLGVTGVTNPVVQVVDQGNDEIVYTLRIKGRRFQPKVFKQGTYTIKVGEPVEDRWEILKNIQSLNPGEKKTLQIKLPQNQAKSLFNGKDLTGWHVDIPNMDKDPNLKSAFIVRDGLLVSLGTPKGHLITDAVYKNYRLEVQYRFAGKPGNCGILVHASTPRALYKMFPKSIEVQMNHKHAGDFWCIVEDISVPDMVKRRGPKEKWGITEGKARRILNLTDDSEKPVGEWNTMVIECLGDEIKVWVNGDLVNHGHDCTASKGQIAIQAEGSEVEFKKLLLTPITKLSEK